MILFFELFLLTIKFYSKVLNVLILLYYFIVFLATKLSFNQIL